MFFVDWTSAGKFGLPSSVHPGHQRAHLVREGKKVEVMGGIDFSTAAFDEDSGKMCVVKEVEVATLNKEPLLECTHK